MIVFKLFIVSIFLGKAQIAEKPCEGLKLSPKKWGFYRKVRDHWVSLCV
jgi:hypothetical protein